MKFTIIFDLIFISIEGVLRSYPNTEEGFRSMAAEWCKWRRKK